jgi:RNA polymerase sigma factor (sigma-70 family)
VVCLKNVDLDENGYLANMSDLKASYRATYRLVKDSMDRCNAESSAANKGVETEHKDNIIKKDIIKDLNIAINWMHTGRMQGGRRGAERRSAYQMKRFIDPLRMQSYSDQYNSRSASTLTGDQLLQIEKALGQLTENERKCYVMAHGESYPLSEIANTFGITKGTVQKYVERAKKKVSHYLEVNLFIH